MDIDNIYDTSFVNIHSFEDLEKFLITSDFSTQLFDLESIVRKNYEILGKSFEKKEHKI